MTHRIAFAGFRHPHIMGLWARAKEHPDCRIVAAWEGDAATRQQLETDTDVELTHASFEQMLDESDFTIVAIGDVYGHRGALAIAALEAGKHIICDKPISTSLEELEKISQLAEQGSLSVGCQLDLVEMPSVQGLRKVITDGTLGSICTITIGAQHPLRFDSRASWYFEPGKHGGTINDIGIHIFDLVPWLTGSNWKMLLSARTWNAKAVEAPHFKDCAQFLSILENGASCFADVSYLAPDKLGYELAHYWRITVHGTKGMAEISYGDPSVLLVTDEDAEPRKIPAPEGPCPGYLEDFLQEIEGSPSKTGLTTQRILAASRQALDAQAVADSNTD